MQKREQTLMLGHIQIIRKKLGNSLVQRDRTKSWSLFSGKKKCAQVLVEKSFLVQKKGKKSVK